MLHIDYQAIEQLKQVSAFFAFLQKPEEFKKIVAEAARVLDEMEGVVAAYTQVETAKEYLAKAKQVLDVAKKDAADVKAEQDKVQAKAASSLATKNAELADWEQKIHQRAKAVGEQEDMLAAARAQLLKDQATHAQMVSDMEKQRAYLRTLEEQLRDREAKIKEVMRVIS